MNPARRPRLDTRAAGILLHVTSLPGPLGVGDLGAGAEQFVRFLRDAGQRWWQMLPITPAGPGNSPYSSISAFAGDTLLIDPQELVRYGWLDADVLEAPSSPAHRVDYPRVRRLRGKWLRRAFERFAARRPPAGFERFCHAQRWWLEDYALFCALKRAHRNRPWYAWPAPLRDRQPAALRQARRQLADEVRFVCFAQYVFARQWARFRGLCRAHGVGLIGDLPLFVAHDSCDVWAHRALFTLDARGRLRWQTGVPPDFFSRTGQLWGHPQFAWREHERTRFSWWVARFAHCCARFDAIRVDHFLGFVRSWAVPGGARTALRGHWRPSPGRALFDRVFARLGRLNIIAEDLGVVTPRAVRLRDALGLPGMRLLQNAFGCGARYDQPHNYPRRCVAYTGTHDNDTTVGWFRKLPRRRGEDGLTPRQRVLRYTGTDGRRIHRDLIRLLYASHADLVIVPMQDVLGLGSEARMNRPGHPRGNWRWRVRDAQLDPRTAEWLASLAETFERSGA